MASVIVLGSENVPFQPVEDSRTCEASGGVWRTDGKGMALRCYIAGVPEPQCRKRGGRWQQFAFENAAACQIPHPEDRQLIECSKRGGNWGMHGARVEHCFYEPERKTCIEGGGTWAAWGKAGISRCRLTMPDGGKPCTSSSQCQNYCQAKVQPVSAEEAIVGECARYNTPRECDSRVENGRFVLGPICD
jgi:hypothetical protein